MPQSTLSTFTCALITGGASGIGRAIAEHLISQDKKVILAGRTESTLRETSAAIGATAYYVLDTGDTAAIPSFVRKLTSEHPEVDCLINNAGVQRPLSLNHMSAEEFLKKGDQEIDINIRGPMHLALCLVEHFRAKDSAAIMNVSSLLGYNPISVINPVYNGTKAWIHFFTMNLRTQLKGSSIKVVEIVPPTVATDLHRERSDPDDNKKEKNQAALSLDEFMDFVKKGFSKGRDAIGAGIGEDAVKQWYGTFGQQYEQASEKFDPSTKP